MRLRNEIETNRDGGVAAAQRPAARSFCSPWAFKIIIGGITLQKGVMQLTGLQIGPGRQHAGQPPPVPGARVALGVPRQREWDSAFLRSSLLMVMHS